MFRGVFDDGRPARPLTEIIDACALKEQFMTAENERSRGNLEVILHRGVVNLSISTDSERNAQGKTRRRGGKSLERRAEVFERKFAELIFGGNDTRATRMIRVCASLIPVEQHSF